VLGKTRNVRTEQPAAGGHDQPIVGEALLRTLGGDDAYRAGFGVDGFGTALHVVDIDRLEHFQQRRRQGFGLRFVKPWANHQRRLRGNQRDFELLGRNAPNVAQASSGKCSVHAGEAGANDDDSHVSYSSV
jgi:hypothetical protein